LYGRDLLDLLQEFPTELAANQLVALLRKLPPRLYSIASSPAAHPDELHLTVAAVRYKLRERLHKGVASTFLADRLLTDETLPVFIERNEYFKLPANPETDIIMVGPGTGVAPFRSFVAERAEIGATGKNWLFFGNPHFETDFLYQTEWQQHLKRGTLDRLSVAFSRDQSEKIYVQHRLLEHSRALFERIENGAHIYICGDKNRMAVDVKQTFLNIISTESGKNAEFAEAYFANLRQQRRYLEDVY
jgi:sulfite reductase (NADPH) flavoprotein alpha-component